MAQYEYTVVPFIGKIKYSLRSTETVAEVAQQLTSVIQQHAAAGWMFHSINSVNIEVKPGCIASLFGRVTFYKQFDQIVLYREAGNQHATDAASPVSAGVVPTVPTPVVPPSTPPPIPQ